MKNKNQTSDDQHLDAAITASLLSNPVGDSQALQDRILYETTGLAQVQRKSQITTEKSAWLLRLPIVKQPYALAASIVIFAVAIMMFYSPERVSIIEPISTAVLTQPAKLELVKEPLSELVWDEVLLLEDELAFANL